MQWMGPGYRVGWATAAPALRQKLEFAQFAACLGPSSLAQASAVGIRTLQMLHKDGVFGA